MWVDNQQQDDVSEDGISRIPAKTTFWTMDHDEWNIPPDFGTSYFETKLDSDWVCKKDGGEYMKLVYLKGNLLKLFVSEGNHDDRLWVLGPW